MACEIRIGTSGWHYKHWRGPFYPPDLPADRMLDFYLARFDTVEINNSFYRLPLAGTLDRWRDQTPPGFCFAVKASRYLTHRKKLKDPEPGLARFLPLIERLGDKLGPILFQLPPNWRSDPDRLGAFLAALPGGRRYSFEFRDPSWHAPAIYRLLIQYNAAFCMYDLAGFQSPMEVTTNFVYVRLHGPGGKYQGSYSAGALQAWADRIDKWRGDLLAVYVYFDNDQAGYAAANAQSLKELVGVASTARRTQ